MNNAHWYIFKRSTGHCEIVSSNQPGGDNDTAILERWGPFTSQDEALARRVGLIRAGKVPTSMKKAGEPHNKYVSKQIPVCQPNNNGLLLRTLSERSHN